MLSLLLALTYTCRAQTYNLSTETTTEYWQPITSWHSSMDAATAVQALFWMTTRTGNFQARLGIQIANFPEMPSAPVSIGTLPIGSGVSFLQLTGQGNAFFYRFNPNDSNNGDIDTKAQFRLGILYSLSAAGSGQGVVLVEGLRFD